VVAVLIFFCAVGNFFNSIFSGGEKHSLKNFGLWAGLQRFLRVCFLWVGFFLVAVEKFSAFNLSSQRKWL